MKGYWVISALFFLGCSPDEKRSDFSRYKEDIYLGMEKNEVGEILRENNAIHSWQEDLNAYRIREELGGFPFATTRIILVELDRNGEVKKVTHQDLMTGL